MKNCLYKKYDLFYLKVFFVLFIVFCFSFNDAFSATKDEYREYYNNDDNFDAYVKPLYIAGYGGVSMFSNLLSGNKTSLKQISPCSDLSSIQDLCLADPINTFVVNEYPIEYMLNPNYFLSAAVGLNTRSAFRAEIAYNYFASTDGRGYANSNTNNYKLNFKSQNLMFNAYFDILNDRRESPTIVPYIIAGIGFSQNTLSMNYNLNNQLIQFADSDNSSFAYTAGIGFSTSVSYILVLDISFRYFNFGNVALGPGYKLDGVEQQHEGFKGKINESYQIMAGLRIQI